MTKAKEKSGKAASLPPFYKRPMALNARGHRHAGIRAAPGYGFARAAMTVPLRVAEFIDAMRDYPIVFTDKGETTPLAVLGHEAGVNLFVDEAGAWRAGAYLPLYARRYPFIGMGPPGAEEMSLAIDTGSGLYAAKAQEGRDLRLFDDAEELTEVAWQGVALCAEWNAGHNETVAFILGLKEQKLLRPGRLDLTLSDGRVQVIEGFLEIDEAAFRALPGPVTAVWHVRGWLDLITLLLASQRNWPRLAALPRRKTCETPTR